MQSVSQTVIRLSSTVVRGVVSASLSCSQSVRLSSVLVARSCVVAVVSESLSCSGQSVSLPPSPHQPCCRPVLLLLVCYQSVSLALSHAVAGCCYAISQQSISPCLMADVLLLVCYQSVSLSVFPSCCATMMLSVSQSVCLSVCQSPPHAVLLWCYQSVSQSVCLSVCQESPPHDVLLL